MAAAQRLLVATHNAGKLAEFAKLLDGVFAEIVSLKELGLPVPQETGTTFVENALIKARAAAAAANCLTLADDSGLCVTALNNAPGVYTADWVDELTLPGAMQRVIEGIGDNPDRSAAFVCTLVLCRPDGSYDTVEGRVPGTIAPAPRGNGGHGYDPIFIPDGHTRTFAEMSLEEKNGLSHRGRAFAALRKKFLL